MAGITLAEAETNLAAALANLAKVRAAEAYGIAGRSLRRPALDAALAEVKYWNQMVQNLSARAAGRGRARTVIVG